MTCDLEPVDHHEQAVWRIGHAPTPWRFTDWVYADRDGRFDGRWDDPDGSYRVLYASTTRFGAFMEALGARPHGDRCDGVSRRSNPVATVNLKKLPDLLPSNRSSNPQATS